MSKFNFSILVPLIFLSAISISINAQISGINSFVVGNHVEVGIDGDGGFEGADLNVGTLPGLHWRSDPGNDWLGFVADPQMSGWTNFDGDFFTPGDPENGWGVEIGGVNGVKLSNNCSGPLLDMPGAILNHTNEFGCISTSWHADYSGSGYDMSFDISYQLNENDLFYITEVAITNEGTSIIDSLFYYRNFDPDNNEVLNGDYETTNTIVSQPFTGCQKSLVSAEQFTPANSYVGLAAIGGEFRVSYGGFSNRDASDIWFGNGFVNTVGSSATVDEAIALAFLAMQIQPGETIRYRYAVILDAANADAALNDLYKFNYTGAVNLQSSFCAPSIDTANICTSETFEIELQGQGIQDFTWEWSPTTGLSNSTGVSNVANPSVSTLYTLTGTPISSCYSSSIINEIYLVVNEGPDISYVDPGTQCQDFDVSTLTVTDANNIGLTVLGFYNELPEEANDPNGLMSGTVMMEGDSVWVVVSDTVTGCFDYEYLDINWGGNHEFDLTIQEANCTASDGMITVNSVNGGTLPNTYTIDGVVTAPVITGLSSGAYLVEATDALGCISDTIVLVGSISPLTLQLDSVHQTECGNPVGSIFASAANGATPYQYSIGGVTQSNGMYTGLTDSTYVVTVLDADGCQEFISVVVTDTFAMEVVVVNLQHATCLGTGSVTLEGLNGVQPITYNIGLGAQASPTFSGLTIGTYNITVVENNGCSSAISVEVLDTVTLAFESLAVLNEGCSLSNGSIFAVGGSGAPNYSYSINGAPAQSSGTFSNLSAGTFTIQLTDQNGCVVDSTVTLSNTNSDLGLTVVNVVPESCGEFNGSIELGAIDGLSPYTFELQGLVQTSPIFTNLNDGSYVCTVIDATNCEFSINVNVSETPFVIDLGEDFTMCEDSLFGFENELDTYLWSTGSTSNKININETDTYSVMVTHNGCTASDSIYVNILGQASVIVPNVFTPNGDTFNDELKITTVSITNFTISIYNRWGKLIFESNSELDSWDGNVKSKEASPGVYFYVVEYYDNCSGQEVKLNGALELFR